MSDVTKLHDDTKLIEQINHFDSLSDKERVDYFCAVIHKLVEIINEPNKNVFDNVVKMLKVSPRYHRQLLTSGILSLFNNIWTHEQLVILTKELLEYNESFVCNTGEDLTETDLSDFIFSKIQD